MVHALKRLHRILDRGTKARLVILLAAIIIGSFLEMLTLALISPLVSVLMDPSIVQTNRYIAWAFVFFGFTSIHTFLATLTLVLSAMYIFRGLYLYAVIRIQYRFIALRQASLYARLLSKLLGFSYSYHARRNVADTLRVVVQDVSQLFQMIVSVLMLLTDFFVALFITVLLLIVSPLMTLMIVVLASLCVLIYLYVFRNRMQIIGEKYRDAWIGMTKSVNQGIGGIKEVKQLNREDYFYRVFKTASDVFAKMFSQQRVLNAMPRLIIESVCFGGAFTLLGVFMLGGVDIATLVPQLSLFVLAAFRLLPAVSRIAGHVNDIIFNKASVNAVYKSLFEESDPVNHEAVSDTNAFSSATREHFTEATNNITIHNIDFQYPLTHALVLENVNFIIPEKKSVAFIGSSGVGKTTIVDLILGVLTPDSGGVFYGGKSVHHNRGEWSKLVGYIPQQIYLLDESIRENVAFGIDREKIDETKIWKALEQAQLADFVRSIPDGLDTIVGDRGVRLSGGQRQRVGIARAMYEDPPILVLDEATSSLDNETEKAVMDAVMGFQGNKTMLIVAHRLSTIEHCDIVYRVEGKKITREK